MTSLDKEKFYPLFGDWWPKIEPFFDNGGFDKIYKFLKGESLRGKKIIPDHFNTFRCFKETSYNNLKGIIAGFSPYPSIKNGECVADGLLMSCGNTNIIQPSLHQFYNSLERELYEGLNVHMIRDPDLTYLARAGILLLNTSLTCEQNKAGSHEFIWHDFMSYLFENVFITGAPIVFLGAEAAKYEKEVFPFTYIFKLPHPAFSARIGEDWNSDGIFKKLNKILMDNHGETIEWARVER